MKEAIPVKLEYTVVREAWDEPTREGSVAGIDGRRADSTRRGRACDKCADDGGDASPSHARGGRWLLVYRGRTAGGASLGRCGRGAGGLVQSARAGGGRAAA